MRQLLKNVKIYDGTGSEPFQGDILLECGEKLTVTCGEGSAMETYLQRNYPDIRIVHPKK